MKRALVLAGGGSRGAYQIGVWRALRELGWNFDMVTGTSVGAINGGVIVMGEYDLAVELWEKLDTASVFELSIGEGAKPSSRDFVRVFLKEGGAGVSPLKKILEETYDLDRIFQSKMELGIMTFNLTQRKPEGIFVSEIKQKKEKLIDYILASAAFFPALKLYQIGSQRYIDGGYYNKMPVDMAIEKGAEEIIAVDLEAVGFTRNRRLKEAKIKYIRPYWGLGNMLFFDPDTAKRNLRLGYLDTLKSFNIIDGRAYAIVKNQFGAFYREKKKDYDLLRRRLGISEQSRLQPEKLSNFSQKQKSGQAHQNSEYEQKAYLFSAMEQAGEILGLDPERIYSLSVFHQRLLAAYHSVPLLPKMGAKSLKALFDKKKTLKFLTQVILEQIRQDSSVKLSALSRLFPEEMKGALYLVLLLL